MIQTVILRMSTNSFLLKGWTVTFVAALFALAAKESNRMYFLISYLPAAVFWFLDAYYISNEHLYREKFNQVRQQDEQALDYSLEPDTPITPTHLPKALLNGTLLIFYLPILLVLLVTTIPA
jgi:hypothetical protein